MKNLEKLLDLFEKHSGKTPYAFLCNKKTYNYIAKELGIDLTRSREYKIPTQISFRGIPIFKCQYFQDNKVLAVDEDTLVKIMEGEKTLWRDYLE